MWSARQGPTGDVFCAVALDANSMSPAQTIRAILIIDSLTFWAAFTACSPTYYESDQILNDCPDVRSGSKPG